MPIPWQNDRIRRIIRGVSGPIRKKIASTAARNKLPMTMTLGLPNRFMNIMYSGRLRTADTIVRPTTSEKSPSRSR
jgi:hypothetical protein